MNSNDKNFTWFYRFFLVSCRTIVSSNHVPPDHSWDRCSGDGVHISHVTPAPCWCPASEVAGDSWPGASVLHHMWCEPGQFRVLGHQHGHCHALPLLHAGTLDIIWTMTNTKSGIAINENFKLNLQLKALWIISIVFLQLAPSINYYLLILSYLDGTTCSLWTLVNNWKYCNIK